MFVKILWQLNRLGQPEFQQNISTCTGPQRTQKQSTAAHCATTKKVSVKRTLLPVGPPQTAAATRAAAVAWPADLE